MLGCVRSWGISVERGKVSSVVPRRRSCASEGSGGFAVLAEDVLDGILGAVVLFTELEAAVFVAFVLADDVEFGVDGEFALRAEFLMWRCVLALVLNGAVVTF